MKLDPVEVILIGAALLGAFIGMVVAVIALLFFNF
jgi:hypothetical protein